MNDEQLLDAANESLRHWLAVANAYFSVIHPTPEVNFRLRGKSAGKAYLQLNEIRLNLVLFRENYHAFVNEVIPHELAHLLTFQHAGKVKPHGHEWQFVMTEIFGLAAQATHQFDITSVAGKVFLYRCNCDTHQLSVRRHNKIQRGQAEYRCRCCQTPLIFIKE